MSQTTNETRDIQAECEAFRGMSLAWKNSICSRIVGLGDSLEQTLWCLLANGHILLEGVPGLGKTLLVQTISQSAGLRATRIQCTPDLMPAGPGHHCASGGSCAWSPRASIPSRSGVHANSFG